MPKKIEAMVDTESAVEEMKNKKFGLSIQNIIALVTVLSTGIAGWYSFTGRIDGLEDIVTGFADASDIELVTSKLEGYDEDIKYLRDKLDNLKTPKVKSYDKDVANLTNEIKGLKREIKKLEELLKDPLADFK
jgi:peptidoglycan hydrolase CwlO-like protein|tara:strand:+ start:89 stop:487 length:399 start_codon:yes stop_codon:yes gene_type:complete